ncbi:hypothetical protein CNY89_01950 [Amaricoccus sp. HAR-UPW-R2A-40]|nr:hypothetical protein CNY89_01950 [Amaricoccus sp. HAR-UPW-R2A-40]
MNAQVQAGAPATPAARPVVRSISVDDVYKSVAQGWRDFKAAPRYGMFFGAVYALGGMAIFALLWLMDISGWILPLAAAFPLVGPFVAIGLYEVSRRLETGEPLGWSEVLGVVWRERERQMPSMAFVVLAGFMIWTWAAWLLGGVVLASAGHGAHFDLDVLFGTRAGLTLLVMGTLVGGVIAFVLFAVTVVAIPMLMDRDVDYVTALVTSFRATTSNLVPMLTWAAVIAAMSAAAMVPFFLGLIVALPVLGHATWHIYRKVIAPQ